jgi:hypothetical protein
MDADDKPAEQAFTDFPFYPEAKVPRCHRHQAEISCLDELEPIWRKPWGAQGIGDKFGGGIPGNTANSSAPPAARPFAGTEL